MGPVNYECFYCALMTQNHWFTSILGDPPFIQSYSESITIDLSVAFVTLCVTGKKVHCIIFQQTVEPFVHLNAQFAQFHLDSAAV